MPYPEKFQLDIDSKETTLITRVVIYTNPTINLSTHSFRFENSYYMPLLLNIPKIKESIDVFNRKFKISSTTLEVSNIPFREMNINSSGQDISQRERFSSILYNSNLINTEVRIFFQPQSAESSTDCVRVFTGIVRNVKHNDKTATIELEDMTDYKLASKQIPIARVSNNQLDPEYQGKPIPAVYGHVDFAPTVIDTGKIIKADSEPLNLVTYQGAGTPYHAVNNVDSPIGSDTNYSSHRLFKLTGETALDIYNIISPVSIASSESKVGIPIETVEKLKDDMVVGNGVDYYQNSEGGVENSVNFDSWNLNEGSRQWQQAGQAGHIRLVSNAMTQKGYMQGISFAKPSEISLTHRSGFGDTTHNNGYSGSENSGYDNPERFNDNVLARLTDDIPVFYDLDDPSMLGTDSTHITSYYHNTGWRNQLLMRLKIGTSPDFEHVALSRNIRFAINEFVFPRFVGKPQTNMISGIRYNKMFIPLKTVDTNFFQGSYGSSLASGYDWDIGGANNTVAFYLHESFDGSGSASNEWCDPLCKEFKYLLADKNGHFLSASTYSGFHEDNQPGHFARCIHLHNPYSSNQGFSGSDMFYSGHPTDYMLIDTQTFDEGYIGLYFGIHYFKTQENYDMTTVDGVREHTLTLGGAWSEIDLRYIAVISNATKQKFFLNVDGRTNVLGDPIHYPRDIVDNG